MSLRDLPAVHRFLTEASIAGFSALVGPGAVKSAVDGVLDEARRATLRGERVPGFDDLLGEVQRRLAVAERDGLLELVNGTGVLLHTNLGRAPLAREALDAVAAIAGGYSNLEYDLELGARGSRYTRAAALLREVTGAEDALVVNNCAAAVLLVLDTFAKDREVIVSRNQLIEIGGGFRLPDVLARSGATLVEVGTTNRVYLYDFERALSARTALLLRSHPSNYAIQGFVADVAAGELAALGRRAGVTTLEDLGSGALVDLAAYGLPHERTVGEAVRDGIDLVAFSGDKLLGGPQAGIVVGRAALIARLRANPLLRALRVDKATLAALGATLRLYLQPGGVARIPLYAMLAQPLETLRARAGAICAGLGQRAAAVRVTDSLAFAGGGALPLATLPSIALAIRPPGGGDGFARALRRERPPIVARADGDEMLLDLRTIPPERDAHVGVALALALG